MTWTRQQAHHARAARFVTDSLGGAPNGGEQDSGGRAQAPSGPATVARDAMRTAEVGADATTCDEH